MKYQRVVLKISGEALAGPSRFGLDQAVIDEEARKLADLIMKVMI